MECTTMKAAGESTPTARELDEWLRTFYAAATPAQRTILREILEQLRDGKGVDEVSVARRFGKPSPQLLAALDALEYQQAVDRALRQDRPRMH